MTIDSLPFPKRFHELKKITLHSKLHLEQWVIPTGTAITLKTTENFGIVVLPEDCRDVRGFTIPKRLFRK